MGRTTGALFVNTAKAAAELVDVGLVAERPVRFFGAQPAGCGPVADAYASGSTRYSAVRAPATIAHSLAIGTPADGNRALAIVRETGGAIAVAPDEEIVAAIRLVAETEGIFVEPAAGVTVAGLVRLARSGTLDPGGTVVAYLTGNGFKTPDVAAAGDVLRSIAPTLAAFEASMPDRADQLVEV